MTTEYFRGKYFDTVNQDPLALPYFGIFSMSIKEATERVALDMWFSGDFSDIKEPEDWDSSVHDPKLLAVLTHKVAYIEEKLLAAVDSGRLEAVRTSRNLDEKLIPEKTYIKYQSLYDWLLERDYMCGDTLDKWSNSEMEIAMHICEELTYLRSINKRKEYEYQSLAFHGLEAKNGVIDEAKNIDVIAAYKALIIENKHLECLLAHAKSEHPAKVDRPITTRQRRTLLTIIAALCDYSAINPASRNTAGDISKMTEEIGALVSDDTVRKMLVEIPDALESRMIDAPEGTKRR